jgi:hypothetical protein
MPGIIPKVDSETFKFPDEVVDALVDDLDGRVGGSASTTWAVVNHGSTANTARPNVTAVYWIGTVTPANMTSADLYNGPGA